MKLLSTILLFIAVLKVGYAQVGETDSTRKLLAQMAEDTNKVLLLANNLTPRYQFFKSDSALILGQQALALAQKLQFSGGEVWALIRLGEVRRIRGEYPQALDGQLKALQLSRKTNNPEGEANSVKFIGLIYVDLGEYRKGLNYLFQSKEICTDHSLPFSRVGLSYIGNAYEKMGMLDSALYFQQNAFTSNINEVGNPADLFARATILIRLGIINNRVGNTREALLYYREAIQTTYTSGDVIHRSTAQYQIAELNFNLNNLDSAFVYGKVSFANAGESGNKVTLLKASSLLTDLYKKSGNIDSAFYYQQVAMATKDSLFGVEKFRQLQLLTLNEQQRLQQLNAEQERAKVERQKIVFLTALGLFLLIALLLWRNNRQNQKANVMLQQKNEQIQNTLIELKATQSQLIQNEKMASLGELTAGIAHEIQNPLNFVNNFSEVNVEMIDELKQEIDKGNNADAKVIADDVRDNLQKVITHGKRADAIVKGMLQHTRASTGKKEPTDINALADEYLRLSFHGLRAKDKDFNAEFKTDFDESIGKIEVVPQDIGRVFLNLYNNAFYSVNEKKKLLNGTFEPTVEVTTKRVGDKVEISVRDNGTGIPQKAVDKIFQPFFTTKPTGQGTGLGLSLSYDIIKAHAGEIKVDTNDGEGSEFIIQLPFTILNNSL